MANKKYPTGEAKIADAFAAKTLGYNSVEEMNADKKRREKSQATVGGEWDEETATQELKQKEAEYKKSMGLSKVMRDNPEKDWKDRTYNTYTLGQDRAIINALDNNLSFNDAYKTYSENADDYNFDLNEVYRGNVEQLKNMFRARYDELAGVYGMNAPEVAEETADARATKGLDKLQQRDARKTQRLESRNARIAARELRNNARELKRDARRELRTSERELARDIRDLRIPTESAQPSAPISTPTLSTDAERALEILTPKTGYNESPEENFKRELATTTMPYVGVEDEVVPEDEVAASKAVNASAPISTPTLSTDAERALEALTPKTGYNESPEYFKRELATTTMPYVGVEDEVVPEEYSEEGLYKIKGIVEDPVLMGLKAPDMGGVTPIQKEDLEVPKVRVAPATTTSIPASAQVAEEPYKRTNEAIANANKSWRQMLLDNYEKRQAENKKRVRNAQIVGLGKALGDLVAGIWSGAASLKNNAPAVVPAPQASKTAEQVEKLIQEGVVNAQDYDKMMLNLSMQEGKDKIALAKAMDELGVKQRQSEAAHEREMQKINARGNWQQILATLQSDLQSAREAKRASDAVKLAQIKGKIQERIKQLGGVGNLAWFTYESLQELFPGEVEFTTTTTSPDKYGQPQTKTVSGTRKMPQGAAQAKMTAQENERFAKATGLSKEYLPYFSALRKLRDKLGISEQQLGENVKKSIKAGKTIDQILKYHGIE